VFAVRLTSKAHDGDRDFLPIGSGAWDSQGRPSWVDIEQVYSVHREGMRREASAIDVALRGRRPGAAAPLRLAGRGVAAHSAVAACGAKMMIAAPRSATADPM
jgi:hypothetical protein